MKGYIKIKSPVTAGILAFIVIAVAWLAAFLLPLKTQGQRIQGFIIAGILTVALIIGIYYKFSKEGIREAESSWKRAAKDLSAISRQLRVVIAFMALEIVIGVLALLDIIVMSRAGFFIELVFALLFYSGAYAGIIKKEVIAFARPEMGISGIVRGKYAVAAGIVYFIAGSVVLILALM